MCKRDDLPNILREFDRNNLDYNGRLGWKKHVAENGPLKCSLATITDSPANEKKLAPEYS